MPPSHRPGLVVGLRCRMRRSTAVLSTSYSCSYRSDSFNTYSDELLAKELSPFCKIAAGVWLRSTVSRQPVPAPGLYVLCNAIVEIVRRLRRSWWGGLSSTRRAWPRPAGWEQSANEPATQRLRAVPFGFRTSDFGFPARPGLRSLRLRLAVVIVQARPAYTPHRARS